MTQFQIVYCTCPDSQCAKHIAQTLIEEQLAACVNILPVVTSVYRWQGKIEQDQESLLLIKTRSDRFTKLQERIKKLHPYELPELIAVAVSDGSDDYLHWIDRSLSSAE